MAPATPIKLKASAYDACEECTGKGWEDPASGITYIGVTATKDQTVAVDPDVIPLGTWLLIEDMGVFRAEDIGGAIKGNRIDIYMKSHQKALEFGLQEVTAWALEPAF